LGLAFGAAQKFSPMRLASAAGNNSRRCFHRWQKGRRISSAIVDQSMPVGSTIPVRLTAFVGGYCADDHELRRAAAESLPR
jgi:hypothetical protein